MSNGSGKKPKEWMKNFSVGSKGGKRVVSQAGVSRFLGEDGKMVVMKSGDIGPVPDHVIKKLNAGGHPSFVKVPKTIPKLGDVVSTASRDED